MWVKFSGNSRTYDQGPIFTMFCLQYEILHLLFYWLLDFLSAEWSKILKIPENFYVLSKAEQGLKVFSHWLRPCSTIDRKPTLFHQTNLYTTIYRLQLPILPGLVPFMAHSWPYKGHFRSLWAINMPAVDHPTSDEFSTVSQPIMHNL